MSYCTKVSMTVDYFLRQVTMKYFHKYATNQNTPPEYDLLLVENCKNHTLNGHHHQANMS